MSFLARYKDVIVCIIALVVPFFFLKANLKDPGQLTAVDRVILTLSTPVQWAATATAEAVGEVWSSYIYLVDLSDENEQLRFENQRLRAENNLYLETEQEVRRLRRMLTFRETFPGRMMAARVIGRGISEQFRIVRIRLDLGEEQLEKGMPVVTFDGLVGQVNSFVEGYSDVMLSVDRKSNVPVVVQRNGAQGILRGTGELDRYTCEVEYLLRSDEVREGDQLFTSGAGGKFPEGLLAGQIVSIQRENLGLFQKVVVEPAVNFSRLREVFVITEIPGEDEDSLSADRRGGGN
ncbi:MAG: rod shape-determining protein MreC [Deltaproteobacteria bacterium]|nr:rod shape-determining protein MreC [Deltaproteobacteria bacterium]